MGNDDIRLKVSWLTHPKRKKLERRLGAKGALCFIDLLLAVAQSKPAGKLDGWSDEDIAIAGQWSGNAETFVLTLLELRLLEYDECSNTYLIHDWAEHNAYAYHAPERSEKARRAAEARWKRKDTDQCNEQCYEHDLALPSASASNTPDPAPSPKDNDIAPSRKNGSKPAVPLLTIPLIKSEGEFPITQTDIDEWQETFPAVDVLACLKRIRLWVQDNPTKRKTRKGIRKFLTSWLEREQNKGGGTFKSLSNSAPEADDSERDQCRVRFNVLTESERNTWRQLVKEERPELADLPAAIEAMAATLYSRGEKS